MPGARALWLPVLVAAACSGSDAPPNQLPQAVLAEIKSVKLGEAVTLDASGSDDADGYIVAYRFVSADSGEVVTSLPFASHRFAHAGEIDIELLVTDDRGGQGRALRHVTVPAEPPPTCLDDAQCGPGESCIAGDCRIPPCGPDRACPPPLICRQGDCVPPPSP